MYFKEGVFFRIILPDCFTYLLLYNSLGATILTLTLIPSEILFITNLAVYQPGDFRHSRSYFYIHLRANQATV